MRQGLIIVALVWCVGCSAVAPRIVAEPPLLGRPTLAPMLDRVLPGVVNISAVSRVRIEQNPLFNDPFFRQFFGFPGVPRERQVQSLGSGVIVDAARGLIVTTNHVTKNAEQIAATLLDGRRFEATVVGSDPQMDRSVDRIPARNLTARALRRFRGAARRRLRRRPPDRRVDQSREFGRGARRLGRAAHRHQPRSSRRAAGTSASGSPFPPSRHGRS